MALILLAIPSSSALGGHYPRCFRASFLSQCLRHSSNTSALLAWEAPDHASISVHLCVCVGLKQLSRSEGSCLNLCDSTHFLTCGRCFFFFGWRHCWDVMEAEWGHAAPECSKLRHHPLLSCGVCCVLFWFSIQAPPCPDRASYTYGNGCLFAVYLTKTLLSWMWSK